MPRWEYQHSAVSANDSLEQEEDSEKDSDETRGLGEIRRGYSVVTNRSWVTEMLRL